MANLQQAQRQAQQARRQLTERQKRIQEQKERVKEAKKKLPESKSQKALREGKFAGLKGRSRRQTVSKRKRAIEQTGKSLTKAQKQLKQYEEKRLKPFEGKIKAAKERKAAIETIKAARKKGTVWAHAFYGEGLVREIAQEYMNKKKLSKIKNTGGVYENVQTGERMSSIGNLGEDWKKVGEPGYVGGYVGDSFDTNLSNLIPEEQKFKKYSEGYLKLMDMAKKDFKGVSDTGGVYENVQTGERMSSIGNLGEDWKKVGEPGYVGDSFDTKLNIREQKIDLKEKDIDLSDYETRADAFVTSSPTGFGSTAYLRPPLPEERARIKELERKGSFEYIKEKTEEKVVTPTLSFFSPAIDRIRDYSPIGGAFSTTSIILGKTGVEDKPTLGEMSLLFKQTQSKIGESSQDFFETVSSKLLEKSKGRGIKVGGTEFNPLASLGYSFKATGYVAKAAPEILPYFTPAGYLTAPSAELLAVEQKKKESEKYVMKNLKEGYVNYLKDYEEKEKNLKEGYELEKEMNFGEFIKSETGSQIREETLSGIRQESVLPFLMLTGGAVAKGIKYVKGASRRATEKAIAEFSDEPIRLKSITYVDEQTGLIEAKAWKTSASGIKQKITFYGRIAETEKGFKFIPEGTGFSAVTGEVTPSVLGYKLKPRKFFSGTEFEFGTRGGTIKLGNLGKINVFEDIGVTTTIAKKGYFGASKVGSGRINIKTFDISRNALAYKDIRIPTDKRNLFLKYNEKIGVKAYPDETGLVLTRTKKDVIDDVVTSFKGRGEKSSKEFFKRLYSTTDEVITKTDTSTITKTTTDTATDIINLPSISEITPTTIIKTTTDTGTKTIGAGISGMSIVLDKTKNIVSPDLKIDTSIKLATETTERQPTKTKQRFDLGIKSKEKQKIFSKGETLIEQAPKIKEQQRIATLQKTKLKQKQGIKQIARTLTPTTPTPTTPKPSTTKIGVPIVKGGSSAKQLIKGIAKGRYTIFTRKAGKDIEVGKARTKKEATELLFKNLRTTLRAGGFVKKGRKKIKLGLSGKEFRIGKRDPFRVIQRKQERLATAPETKEIQLFRRKSKKNSWGV